MKKLFFVIAFALGGFAISSAQTASQTSASSPAPKAACCQKGGEAKSCCSKETKTASTAQCSGHSKAEASAATTTTTATTSNGDKNKQKAKTTK